jgi:pimeloyl-ACP methyl ester carboxylesterase
MRSASQRYSFASHFLPADKVRHVEALYAFLRVGDDRVDVSHKGFKSPQAAIEAWERTYWRAFEVGDSQDPVMRAYLNTALECSIPRETMAAYFRDAWTTDLRPRVRSLKTPVLLVVTNTTWPASEPWDAARKRLGYETAGPVTARRVEGSGHMVPLDQPDTLAAAILEFTSTLKK